MVVAHRSRATRIGKLQGWEQISTSSEPGLDPNATGLITQTVHTLSPVDGVHIYAGNPNGENNFREMNEQ